jgi:hypothetical protein
MRELVDHHVVAFGRRPATAAHVAPGQHHRAALDGLAAEFLVVLVHHAVVVDTCSRRATTWSGAARCRRSRRSGQPQMQHRQAGLRRHGDHHVVGQAQAGGTAVNSLRSRNRLVRRRNPAAPASAACAGTGSGSACASTGRRRWAAAAGPRLRAVSATSGPGRAGISGLQACAGDRRAEAVGGQAQHLGARGLRRCRGPSRSAPRRGGPAQHRAGGPVRVAVHQRRGASLAQQLPAGVGVEV